MDSPIDLVSFVTRSESRTEVLLTLATREQTRPELQDETGIPRATLSRILADFRDHDLATRDSHQYQTTLLGDLVATELEALFESAGLPVLSLLTWPVGFGSIVLVAWYVWIRPIDF
jgi:predicted transcriptional regulator